MTKNIVKAGNIEFGSSRQILIAGPCSVEGLDILLQIAHEAKTAGADMLRAGAFKPRTHSSSFQGLGFEAIEYLKIAKKETGLPIVVEVLEPSQIGPVLAAADMLQIGTRNMYNYPLLKEVGAAGCPVLLKRGISATIEEWVGAASYIGHDQIVLCERGVRTFDPETRNMLDLCAVPVIQQKTSMPIIVDPSHSTGHRNYVAPMARGALAAGADGLLIESHINPEKSISDSAQTIDIKTLGDIAKFRDNLINLFLR